jgi:hypothetical protein
VTLKANNNMKFTTEELELIKDALVIALNESHELLEDSEGVIKILDKIDEELELD